MVSTCTVSPLSFLEFFSGTLTIVPSRSLSSPCKPEGRSGYRTSRLLRERSALRGSAAHLLHALAADVPELVNSGNAANLIDLVQEDDACKTSWSLKSFWRRSPPAGPAMGCRRSRPTLLCFLHRVVGVLQQFGDDRFDVLAHVSGLRERGAVTDGKGDVQAARQRLRQQRFSCNSQRGGQA